MSGTDKGINVTLLPYNHDFNVPSGSHVIVSLFSCSFLEECGGELKTLKLACCRYITRNTLATIGRVCKDLEGTLLILVCTTIVCENVHHICSHNIYNNYIHIHTHTHTNTHTHTHAHTLHTHTHTHTHTHYTHVHIHIYLIRAGPSVLPATQRGCPPPHWRTAMPQATQPLHDEHL